MTIILHIETSTSICSVSIAKNGSLLSLAEEVVENSHARLLTNLINKCLLKSALSINDLDAVAISIGPGSYTGLRIGLSTAKGICYSKNLPLITISTLKAIAFQAKERIQSNIISILKARKEEVYIAAYNKHFKIVLDPMALDLEKNRNLIENLLSDSNIYIGNGIEVLSRYVNLNINQKIENYKITSVNLIEIAFKMHKGIDFSDLAYSEPHYLKNTYIAQ